MVDGEATVRKPYHMVTSQGAGAGKLGGAGAGAASLSNAESLGGSVVLERRAKEGVAGAKRWSWGRGVPAGRGDGTAGRELANGRAGWEGRQVFRGPGGRHRHRGFYSEPHGSHCSVQREHGIGPALSQVHSHCCGQQG